MKTLLAIAATSLLALSAPAFAQNAGAPGATGTGGGLSGSNPGTGGAGWNYGTDNGTYGDRYDGGPGYYNRGPYMSEGRAAAPDDYYQPTGPDSRSYDAPRRDGALVAPGPYDADR